MPASRAFIELGSNVDAEKNLPRAAAALRRLGEITAVSEVYATKPYGPTDQPDFLNAAVELRTEMAPHALRRALRELEAELGRARGGDRYTPRPIDLDLCLYDELVLENDELTLPHPDVSERAYLARSLADLDPELRHPSSGETMAELAARLEPHARYQVRADLRAQLEQSLSAGRG